MPPCCSTAVPRAAYPSSTRCGSTKPRRRPPDRYSAAEVPVHDPSAEEAALAPEATNDQRALMVPEAGQTFLWATATVADAPASIDLTKVADPSTSAENDLGIVVATAIAER